MRRGGGKRKAGTLMKDNGLIFSVFGAVLIALLWQDPGRFFQERGFLQGFTFLGMFLSGLSLSLKNGSDSLRLYKHIVYAALSSFLVIPLLAFILGRFLFQDSPDLFVGAMIMSTQATTVATAVVITMTAGGNVPLAILMTVAVNFCAAFISPVLLNLGLSVAEPVVFDVWAMIHNLIYVMIVPVLLAMGTKRFLPKAAAWLIPYRKALSTAIIFIFVLAGMSAAAPQLAAHMHILIRVFAFAVLLHGGGLLAALLYIKGTRPECRDVPPLLFCSTQKTLTTSTLIWSVYFSEFLLAPIVMVGYHVIQLCMDAWIATRITIQKAENP